MPQLAGREQTASIWRQETVNVIHAGFPADAGKGCAVKEKYLASVTKEGFKHRQRLPFQCVLSHLFISQDVHTQVFSWPGQLVAPRYVQVLRRLGLQTTS